MPSLSEHESTSIVKLLLLGDSGAGKTGCLASLVDAGLRLRILDFDNGVSVLRGYIKDKARLSTHVAYATLRDEIGLMGARMGIKKASAYQRAIDLLEKGGWDTTPPIPPVTEWDHRDVLVIDSLSSMGRSSLNMVQQINGAGFKQPEIQHYGTAMDNIEKLLDMVTSPALRCHVIISTHTYMPEGSTRPSPEALGSKLGPKVPKVFDNMISLSLTGGQRTFKTDKDGMLALKSAVPLAPTYPITSGMADIFRAITGKKDLV